MTAEEKKLPVYELVYHLLPTLSEGEGAGEAEALKGLIGECGATILSEEALKRVPLAYAMVKSVSGKLTRFDSALMGSLRLEATPEAAHALKTALHARPAILRFILVHTVRELPTPKRAVLREISTKTFERKVVKEEATGPVSEEALEKSLEEMVGEKL